MYLVVILLLILSGLFSGLTLGLMSLNPFTLRRKIKLGDKNAKKVYPLRKEGNLLLCTLLLGNVAVNSALAVFLGSLTKGVVAGLLATSLIVVFGEVLPQALFSRYSLKFGSKFTWLVYFFMYLLYPITKPLALLLDKFLGGELPTVFSKKEFHLFLEKQKELKDSDIKSHEFEILKKGLIFSEIQVRNIMISKDKTFMVSANASLDKDLLRKIHQKGHTRIPVYYRNENKIVGLLYSKDLILVSPKDERKVKHVMRKRIYYISENAPLDKLLSFFKEKKSHLFIVRDRAKKILGIVTLEDVLEEIVGEIVDEYDLIKDMGRRE